MQIVNHYINLIVIDWCIFCCFALGDIIKCGVIASIIYIVVCEHHRWILKTLSETSDYLKGAVQCTEALSAC